MRIRGVIASASLKPGYLRFLSAVKHMHPRRYRLGLIEAWPRKSNERRGNRGIRGVIASASLKQTDVPVSSANADAAHPRRYRLGLIEARPTGCASARASGGIRGVIASASLKRRAFFRDGRTAAQHPRRYRLGLIEASISTPKNGSTNTASEALSPRPH